MPNAAESTPLPPRSPFVAGLVTHVRLDSLLDSMQFAGIVVSSQTLASLQNLRGLIDCRVRQVASHLPATLSPSNAPASPAVQSLLAELALLNERLGQLEQAMCGCGSPSNAGPVSIGFDDPTV